MRLSLTSRGTRSRQGEKSRRGGKLKVLIIVGVILLGALTQTIHVEANSLSPVTYDDGIPSDIRDYCEIIGAEFNICPELLEAICYQESRFIPTVKNKKCYGLMQVNVKVHADQIDKYNMDYEQYYSTVIGSQELKDEFINLYENAEKDIEYLQDIIVQYSKNQIDKETCIDKLLEIYKYNGHALGFYMSNQIIMAGLKDEMIKEFYKPYEFYRLYSLALYKNKGISLNDDFLGFLKEATGELD